MPLYSHPFEEFDQFYNSEIAQEPCYFNGREVLYLRYKFHICVDLIHFPKHGEVIKEILKEALSKKIIACFKVLNQSYLAKTKHEPSRILEIPFTVYLHNQFDEKHLTAVAMLCASIEEFLQDVPQPNKKYLTVSDIPLSKHMTFRQTALENKEYIAATDTRATELKMAGEKSLHFTTLAKKLNAFLTPTYPLKLFATKNTEKKSTNPPDLKFIADTKKYSQPQKTAFLPKWK
jgi:hypothetical protein